MVLSFFFFRQLRLGPEYLVKFRSLSYLHTEWVPETIFTNGDQAAKQRLQRFLKHYIPNVDEEEEPFSTDYIQVKYLLRFCSNFFRLIGF